MIKTGSMAKLNTKGRKCIWKKKKETNFTLIFKKINIYRERKNKKCAYWRETPQINLDGLNPGI